MTYGKRLKTAREHAKLTQPGLAEKSGVSQQTISKIERGKQDGSTYTVQLASACGVRPEWLASETGEMLPAAGRHRVEESGEIYAASLTPGALDVARAWSKLPLTLQNLYRDAIFRDAAVEKILHGFKISKPTTASYDAFEKNVEDSYARHQRQLKLEIDS